LVFIHAYFFVKEIIQKKVPKHAHHWVKKDTK
jgi:hypothetical protein